MAGLLQIARKRQKFIVGGILTVAVFAVWGLSRHNTPSEAASATAPSTPISSTTIKPTELSVYLPTWNLAKINQLNLAANNSAKIDKLILAFAQTTEDGLPTIAALPITSETIANLKSQFPNAKIYLATGGWADSNDQIHGWSTALNNPVKYATELKNISVALRLDGLAIDYEYPKDYQRSQFNELIKQVKTLSGLPVEIAISAEAVGQAGLDIKSLSRYATLELMAYDQNTPNRSSKVGPIANDTWALNSLNDLLASGINKSQISFGMPLYGYRYPALPGKNFATGSTIQLRDIEKLATLSGWTKTVVDDASYLENSGSGESISYVTSSEVASRINKVNQLGVDHVFFWDASGLSDNLLDKLK